MIRAAAGLSGLLKDLATAQRKEGPGSPLQVRTIRVLDETDWQGAFPHTAPLLRHNYSGSRIENKLPSFRATAEIEHVVQGACNRIS